MDEEDIIAKDREQFPMCHYSVRSNQTCANDAKGEFVCESIRQLQRLCPGKSPVTIYSNKTQESGEEAMTKSPFGNDVPKIFGEFGNSSIFGSIFGGSGRDPVPFPGGFFDQFEAFGRKQERSSNMEPKIPPHRLPPYNAEAGRSKDNKKGNDPDKKTPPPRGYITGPVEEV